LPGAGVGLGPLGGLLKGALGGRVESPGALGGRVESPGALGGRLKFPGALGGLKPPGPWSFLYDIKGKQETKRTSMSLP
jgi:hypothetical protein